MKKAVIIFGSPRKNSNTHILMTQARQGLTDSGVSSKVFYLNDLNIKGCQACYYCKKNCTTECAVKDDMGHIYQAIDGADGVVIAAPVYFGAVTAQTKLFQDRMFPYIDINLKSLLGKGKRVSFIFTQNQPDPESFAGNLNSFKFMFEIMGFKPKDTVLAVNMDKDLKPMVTGNAEIMGKAYALGKHLLA